MVMVIRNRGYLLLLLIYFVPSDHLLLERSPNIGPLISRWELDKFKNCWNKSFRTSNILTLLYQQFSNLLISQQYTSDPRLGTLSNNRWSGVLVTSQAGAGTVKFQKKPVNHEHWKCESLLPDGRLNSSWSANYCYDVEHVLDKRDPPVSNQLPCS